MSSSSCPSNRTELQATSLFKPSYMNWTKPTNLSVSRLRPSNRVLHNPVSCSSFCRLSFLSLGGSLCILFHQCFQIVKAHVFLHGATFISSDQPHPVQSPSNQSTNTLLRVFWFHWFRSAHCYCLLLFVLSMLLFAWFHKWRLFLCGTVFILLKCIWRDDSVDIECLWNTGTIHTHTQSIIKRKSHPLFFLSSLPRLVFSGGSVCVCRCRMSSLFSWTEMHHFPFKANAQALTGNMCVIGVLSVWHGATGAAEAENNKNTQASLRIMFTSSQRLCHCLNLKCRTCTSSAKYVPWIIFNARVGPLVRIQLYNKEMYGCGSSQFEVLWIWNIENEKFWLMGKIL